MDSIRVSLRKIHPTVQRDIQAGPVDLRFKELTNYWFLVFYSFILELEVVVGRYSSPRQVLKPLQGWRIDCGLAKV